MDVRPELFWKRLRNYGREAGIIVGNILKLLKWILDVRPGIIGREAIIRSPLTKIR